MNQNARRRRLLASIIGNRAAANFSRVNRSIRAARGERATSTLRGAVNARYSSNPARAGAPVFSRRTGARIGTMVRNAG